MTAPLALLADIGGTNTRVALANGSETDAASIRRFANTDFSGLEPILRRYLDEAGIAAVDGVCVAVAGPVRDNVAEMTNLSWVIDHAQLVRATGAARVAILNDLQAQGQALGKIADKDLQVLLSGPKQAGAAMLVVGLGTGMNAAPVHDTPWGRIVAASECGHVSMPVQTEQDFRLAKFLSQDVAGAHGFAGVEEAIAGRGIGHLYEFITHESGRRTERSTADVMADLARGEPLAQQTAALYVHIMGQNLGNLALTHLPFGGIYLIGGVARAIAPYLGELQFAKAFRDKGRFSKFMESFAVTLVEDDYAALTGCAAYLAQIRRR
jgi:glucokinase